VSSGHLHRAHRSHLSSEPVFCCFVKVVEAGGAALPLGSVVPAPEDVVVVTATLWCAVLWRRRRPAASAATRASSRTCWTVTGTWCRRSCRCPCAACFCAAALDGAVSVLPGLSLSCAEPCRAVPCRAVPCRAALCYVRVRVCLTLCGRVSLCAGLLFACVVGCDGVAGTAQTRASTAPTRAMASRSTRGWAVDTAAAAFPTACASSARTSRRR
jgi:hypothetical protein